MVEARNAASTVAMAWSSRHVDSSVILLLMVLIGVCVSTYLWRFLPTLRLAPNNGRTSQPPSTPDVKPPK